MHQEVVTVRIDRALADKLDQLVRDMTSTRDELLIDAITRFVDEESSLIVAIKRGEADIDAGRVFTQEEVEAMFGVLRERRDAA